MPLPTLTLDGRACTLLLAEPNLRGKGWRVGYRWASDEAEGSTGIEGRAAGPASLMLTLVYRYTLDLAVAADVIAALRTLNAATGKLLLPIWPDVLPAADYAAKRCHVAQHTVNFSKTSGAYAIDASGGHPWTAGLVMGVLSAPPKKIAHTDKVTTFEVEFTEDSPHAARIDVNTLAMASWSLVPNWAQEPEESDRTQLRYRELGQGREQSASGDDAPVKLAQRAGFTLTRDQVRQLLTFWSAKRGIAEAFTMPRFLAPGGAETIQARFASGALVMDWPHNGNARVKIEFAQSLILGGGEPDQHRPARVLLFRLWWTGSSTNHLWTDWRAPLTHSALTYQPQKLDCKPPVENLRPGTSEWEIVVRDFEGCPLRVFSLMQVERQLNLEIRECDPANPSAAALRFVGTVAKAPARGKVFTVKTALLGGALRLLVPTVYVQPNCNTTVFSEVCGAVEATFAQTGTVAVVASTVVDVTTAAAQAADYFAEGYALFGAGDATELRYIARSAPITGGQRLTLHRPLFALGVGAAVTFYPGCDGQYASGCAKIGNQINFFGAPHQPPFIEQVATGYQAKTGK